MLIKILKQEIEKLNHANEELEEDIEKLKVILQKKRKSLKWQSRKRK